MKHIKIYMLLAIALPFIWSCSDNGDDINTGQCTVGFASEEVEINEATSGYTNIPINVSGLRNGAVKIKIEATPVGENGAVEESTISLLTRHSTSMPTHSAPERLT